MDHPNKSNYTVSLYYDRRLYRQDIAGSMAHVRMLARQGIISEEDRESIHAGLQAISIEIENQDFPWQNELEDIHMNIEARLKDKIGPVAGKLHTARSRNDQVVLDLRLYTKEICDRTIESIVDLQTSLLDGAEKHIDIIMPGYTHLQRAQPVLLSHHFLAYFEMLNRDKTRFVQCRYATDVMPLGSGALAGVPYAIDREFLANELGFNRVSANSMDAVSDRDFLIQYQATAAICMMHLSRMAEELVLWSSQEFNFITLDQQYTTGSSIMPQKRNPDFAELGRGKTGRVYGHLMSILTTLKGLPLTYNRDLQEDKIGLFDTVDTLLPTLNVFAGMISTMNVNKNRMEQAAEKGNMLATDVADYLVDQGMPFRDAYSVVRDITNYAKKQNKEIHQLSLEEYLIFSDLFQAEVLQISLKSSVNERNVTGGTSSIRVKEAIKAARLQMEESCEICK